MNTTGYRTYDVIDNRWNVEPGSDNFTATWDTGIRLGYATLSFFVEQVAENRFEMQYNLRGGKDVMESFVSFRDADEKAKAIAEQK